MQLHALEMIARSIPQYTVLRSIASELFRRVCKLRRNSEETGFSVVLHPWNCRLLQVKVYLDFDCVVKPVDADRVVVIPNLPSPRH